MCEGAACTVNLGQLGRSDPPSAGDGKLAQARASGGDVALMSVRPSWIRRLALTAGLAFAALAALLPWWRNHGYLRDFYDYGLVMSGVGRIAAGERPYVDFVTPIQTGTFLFNGWAERAGGGTYQAMTWGAAGLILLGVVGLGLMFARRWPAWVAVLAAAGLTIMSASQHTIVWHNAVGALGLVVVAWAAALAPVPRRGNWPWVALAMAALFIGGINKLNAHLVALACAAAWTLRALARRETDGRGALAALAGWVVAGVVAPVAFEVAWSGATFPAWWHNVIAMPFSSRAGDFGGVWRPEFYLQVRHDYYGGVTIPWLGALGLAATLGTGVVAWRAASGWADRAWAVAAALFAAAAGAGLLATNYEIAWIAMAAWLGLVAALWMGFGLPVRGVGFWLVIATPLLVVGAAAWESAWRGQRSQFGYSTAPRKNYVDAGTVHEDFGYLRGTRLPPEMTQTMNEALQERAKIPRLFQKKIFYGPGLEWLERVWPAVKVRGLPLWLHDGTSYGPEERARLVEALRTGGMFDYVAVTEARNFWPAEIGARIRDGFVRTYFGSTWILYRALPPGAPSGAPLDFLARFGGNADATRLRSSLHAFALSDGREFLGTTEGIGSLTLQPASYRLQLETVIRRIDPQLSGPVKLRFRAFGMSTGELLERGSFDAELPAGEEEKIFATTIDPGGLPMLFSVAVPAELSGRIQAGWRGLQFSHTLDDPDDPPTVRPGAATIRPADEQEKAALLSAEARSVPVFVRLAGEPSSEGLLLRPGGEIWLRVQGGLSLDFALRLAGRLQPPALPVVRVLYYKGGRLDVLTQDAIRAENPVQFHAWSAEGGGWIGLLLDPSGSVPALRVKVINVAR